jgi:PAS domain-containing protein
VAVFVVDPDRNVVLWNGAAEPVLGFSQEEVDVLLDATQGPVSNA